MQQNDVKLTIKDLVILIDVLFEHSEYLDNRPNLEPEEIASLSEYLDRMAHISDKLNQIYDHAIKKTK